LLVRRLVRRKRLDEAVVVLEKARRLAPRAVAPHINLALVRLALRSPAAALRDAEAALVRQPDHPLGLRIAARALVALNRLARASAVFQRALDAARRAGDHATVVTLLAESAALWVARGEAKRARSALRAAGRLHRHARTDLRRHLARSRLRLAMVTTHDHLQASRSRLACSTLRPLLGGANDLPPDERALARVLVVMGAVHGECRPAVDLLRRDGGLERAFRPAYRAAARRILRAQLELARGGKKAWRGALRLERVTRTAKAGAREALERYAGRTLARVGYVALRSGDARGALKALRRAARLPGTDTSGIRHNLATAAYRVGLTGRAVKAWQALEADAPEAACNLGVHYLDRRTLKKALPFLQRCLGAGGGWKGLEEHLKLVALVLESAREAVSAKSTR
jgi:tetratricopeptide (TPR) repeat protein